MNREEFENELKKINIVLTKKQMNQLEKYYSILVTENQKYNLTTITKKEEVYLKHFYDSLTVAKYVDFDNQRICDIGTGAGFPGLVLKIVFPNIKMTLLDSTQKKCNFLNLVIKELSLNDVEVINNRAEEYSKSTREHYDIVISRAVAPLKHLLEYSIPLLKVNGKFISLKGDITNEITNIDNYYNKLKINHIEINGFHLPIENSNRTIFIATKYQKTDDKYPRLYKQIKKCDIW